MILFQAALSGDGKQGKRSARHQAIVLRMHALRLNPS